MGFPEALHWWEDWQLRVLVLASLFLQYFMFATATLRKYHIGVRLRFLTWLAYLASDAAAIYALAALFIRHRSQDWILTHRSNASLEALWAPILLLHLGGQDAITAYNIEDNELWMRHLLTALSQITVAIYVFWKSWPSDQRLLQAAILIFVPGILKCLEKPWALRSASINSLVKVKTSSSDEKGKTIEDKEKDKTNSLDEYVQAARERVQEHSLQRITSPYDLFVDLQYPYSARLDNLAYMSPMRDEAHQLVKYGLSKTFDRLYTKEQMLQWKYMLYRTLNPFYTKTKMEGTLKAMCGMLIREVVVFLTFAAIGLFHNSHRKDYDGIDVKITYILLSCTAVLELLQSGFPAEEGSSELPWPEHVAQYNLLGYLARNRKHTWFRKLLGKLHCKDYLDQLCPMKPCLSSSNITKRVHDHVMHGWKDCIEDTASYRVFNDNRGQLTLREGQGCENLEWSLRRPFDESVLLWHLATDFCIYYIGTSPDKDGTIGRCRVMSNYMAYLLYVNPEMLIAGARSSLFRAAYNELKKAVVDEKNTLLDEGELMERIIQKMKGTEGSGFVHDAWALAEALRRSCSEDKKEKMWKVIEGVWVEMLCFSAGRCRGYLHAKSLGKGGEYLSYVWLLLQYMGMESLAERLHRTVLQEEGDMGSAGLTPLTMRDLNIT